MYAQIAANKRKTALLMMVFIAFIIFLGWAIGQITELGYSAVVVASAISLVMVFFSYFAGDKVALAVSGARPITKEDNPYVHRLVENLCISAGQPLPKIYIIQDPALNAFATGRDPKHAHIALTSGIIEALENEELEGVIAHELSHIKNYDIRVMTVVIVLVGIVVLLSDFLTRSWIWRRRDNEGSNVSPILALVGIILAILSPLIAELIKLAVSRRREYLADVSGALLTRYPDGLASALAKIAAHPRPLQRASTATAHLYISNPFAGGRRRFATLFSTHPPIEERIKKLRAMTL